MKTIENEPVYDVETLKVQNNRTIVFSKRLYDARNQPSQIILVPTLDVQGFKCVLGLEKELMEAEKGFLIKNRKNAEILGGGTLYLERKVQTRSRRFSFGTNLNQYLGFLTQVVFVCSNDRFLLYNPKVYIQKLRKISRDSPHVTNGF